MTVTEKVDVPGKETRESGAEEDHEAGVGEGKRNPCNDAATTADNSPAVAARDATPERDLTPDIWERENTRILPRRGGKRCLGKPCGRGGAMAVFHRKAAT